MNTAIRLVRATALLWLGAATTGPVALRPQPGTALDATARQLVAEELASAGLGRARPLVLIGTASLGATGDRSGLFIQLQSPRECGSAGCSTLVYVQGQKGKSWQKVLDATSGTVVVDAVQHRGMHDLILNGNDRWVWTGASYADTRPAPVLNLRPRSPHHGRAHGE